jgi:hypothetical protein
MNNYNNSSPTQPQRTARPSRRSNTIENRSNNNLKRSKPSFNNSPTYSRPSSPSMSRPSSPSMSSPSRSARPSRR